MDATQMAAQLGLSIGIDEPCQTAFAAVTRERFWDGPDPYDPSSGGLLKAEGGEVVSTASMPFAMAQILLAAELRDGMRVMEAGAGSGYMAAILAVRLGQENVVTVESDPDMAQLAADNLKAVGLGRVRVVAGDALTGVPGERFDAILGSFSVTGVPAAWLAQCSTGRIVAPWATRWTCRTDNPKVWAAAVLDVRDGTASGRFYPNNRFMQAHSQRFEPIAEPPARLSTAPLSTGPRLRFGAVTGKFHPAAAFYTGLVLPDVGYRIDEGVMTVSDGTSWARVTNDEIAMHTQALQAGPRQLWAEIQQAHIRWCALRHPSIDRFGLTAGASGGVEYWLDVPTQPAGEPGSGSA